MEATEAEFQEALDLHGLTKMIHESYVTASNTGKEEFAESYAEAIRLYVPPGLYEHWKSEDGDLKFYVVCDVTLEVDVHYPSVSYKSLYGKRAGKPAARHLIHTEGESLSKADRGFLTPIDRPEYRGPRFRPIIELSRKEINVLLDHVGELAVKKDRIELFFHIGRLLKKNIPMF